MNRSRACGRTSTSMNNRPDAVILDVMSLQQILKVRHVLTVRKRFTQNYADFQSGIAAIEL